MRTLFSLVSAVPSGRVFDRPSVRAIILRGGRIAMVHSLKYDYYKFPGGGIEAGESHLEALLREAREEAGLRILPESVREYGVVPRAEHEPANGIHAGEYDFFTQDNFYYLCDAGMCLAMGQIGSGTTGSFVLGIAVGIVGMAGMGVNYPIYKRLLENGKRKYAYEILELAREISEQ